MLQKRVLEAMDKYGGHFNLLSGCDIKEHHPNFIFNALTQSVSLPKFANKINCLSIAAFNTSAYHYFIKAGSYLKEVTEDEMRTITGDELVDTYLRICKTQDDKIQLNKLFDHVREELERKRWNGSIHQIEKVYVDPSILKEVM